MHQESFASVAHRILISEKRGAVREVAASVGLTPECLYNRLHDRTPFQIEEVRKLLAAVPVADLANCVLARSPFFAAEKSGAESEFGVNMLHGATRSVLEAADVLRTIQAALEDGRIDHRERPIILKQIEEAERALASLKQVAARG